MLELFSSSSSEISITVPLKTPKLLVDQGGGKKKTLFLKMVHNSTLYDAMSLILFIIHNWALRKSDNKLT